jgi:hypothetical protein
MFSIKHEKCRKMLKMLKKALAHTTILRYIDNIREQVRRLELSPAHREMQGEGNEGTR